MTETVSLTEQNRAAVAAMYAVGMAGDVEGMLAYLDDDIVVYEPLYLPYGKAYRGKKEFVGLFELIQEFLDISQITLHYTIADGDRVAACLGIPDVTTRELVHLLEQSTLENGKVKEMKLFYYDPGTMLEKAKI